MRLGAGSVCGGDGSKTSNLDPLVEEGAYEDLSGFTISRKVEVIASNASMNHQWCTWFGPCDATWPKKARFTELRKYFGKEKDNLERAEPISFVVFRINVCRTPTYFMENITLIVVFFNIVNLLSLLLSPKSVDARLASVATMVLALAAIQAFVADDTPRASYQTYGQLFIKYSNALMVAAGAESVLVYLACVGNFSFIRLFVWTWDDPNGELVEAEMQMFDHFFLVAYVIVYTDLLVFYFPGLKGIYVPIIVVFSLLMVALVPVHAFRLRRLANSVAKTQDGQTQEAESGGKESAVNAGQAEPSSQGADSEAPSFRRSRTSRTPRDDSQGFTQDLQEAVMSPATSSFAVKDIVFPTGGSHGGRPGGRV